ncbi:MAG: hypothetical protein KAT05_08805, partial [Spirochaetes bacterium]|nr:hypothetical protein [Spirochaetota bacterium]
FLFCFYSLFDASFFVINFRGLSLFLISLVITEIMFSIYDRKHGFDVNIQNPKSFYGLFYLLYYVLPYLFAFTRHSLPLRNEFFIAIILSAGYFAWSLGIKFSGLGKVEYRANINLSLAQAKSLLVMCSIGVGLVAYYYILRIKMGNFIAQGLFIPQELTVMGSFKDVFIVSLKFPIILILGLIATVDFPRIREISRKMLWTYSGMLFLILTFSSKTRPAITAFLFFLVALKFYRKITIKYWNCVLSILLVLASVTVIQGLRAVKASDFKTTDNQLKYGIVNAVPSTVESIRLYGPKILEKVSDRSEGSVTFLSMVIDTMDQGKSFLYGKNTLNSLDSLIPRFIWPSKPAVVPPEILVQEILDMPQHDATLGPIIQFYVTGGLLIVLFGYFIFGWCIGRLTKYLRNPKHLWGWILLFFTWSVIANLEKELVLGVSSSVRNALVVYLIYRVFLIFMGNEKKSGS